MPDNIPAGGPAVAAPAAPPAAPAAPAVPASPADGRVGDSPPPSPDSVGLKQLREQYESLKTKVEPWDKLGVSPDVVAKQFPLVQKMHTEALALGRDLGYDASEVEEFFAKDPVQVLAYLRQQSTTRQAQPLTRADLQKDLDRMVAERLQPITQREDLRMNKEAEFRFDSEFNRLFTTEFKDGLPEDVKTLLYEQVGTLLGEDDAAIRRLKFDGQIADVAKYFEQAKTRVLKAYTAWSAHEKQRTQGPGSPPNPPEKSKSRLDVKLSTGQTVKELMNI